MSNAEKWKLGCHEDYEEGDLVELAGVKGRVVEVAVTSILVEFEGMATKKTGGQKKTGIMRSCPFYSKLKKITE